MRLNPAFWECAGRNGTVRARDSQPRLLRFDRTNLLWINESRVRRQPRSVCCNGRLRLCSAEKNGKTDAVVQPDSTSFPLANISPGGHPMPQPPRHAQRLRVDLCHPWFQNAIHRRLDELDVNPRSVVPSCANASVNRAAANQVSV